MDNIVLPGSSPTITRRQSEQHKSPKYGHQRSSQELWGESISFTKQVYPLFSWIGWLRPTSEANVRWLPSVCGRLSLCLVCVRNQWEVHGLYIWYVLQVRMVLYAFDIINIFIIIGNFGKMKDWSLKSR